MQVITARNVNDAYRQGIELFKPIALDAQAEASRAGMVYELGPVTTHYLNPQERVLWDAQRDCNPFFHLFESLWMLAGRSDVDWLTQFSKNITDFSDEHGAYGNRWRNWFSFDQIDECVKMLKRDPTTRRCMLTMWSPCGDLVAAEGGAFSEKDVPCNVMIKFETRRNGSLDMFVFNRSNDMIYGAYGANAVHMSFLQEYVANCLNISMGQYWQISANFHVYEKVWNARVDVSREVDRDLYTGLAYVQAPTRMALLTKPLCTQEENAFAIQVFLESETYLPPVMGGFIEQVCGPLLTIWRTWKSGDRAMALMLLGKIPYQRNEWVVACQRWMHRRIVKTNERAQS